MSTRVTRKRARRDSDAQSASVSVAEEQGPAQQQPRSRDEEFWYEDGNIILVAGEVEFRVYKGILSDYSPVFQDMFSLPQPPPPPPPQGKAAAVDSCPIVHLSDSPEDVRHMLRVCMPKPSSSPFAPDDPSYAMVSATIRLGHKYQMSALVDHGVAYLKSFFTDDMEEWVASGTFVPSGFGGAHAIGVVNLARLAGELSILPTAFVACCKLGADIFKGFKREDGTHEELAPDDLARCFAGYIALVERGVGMALRVFHPDNSKAEGCTTRSECRRALQGIVADLHKKAANIADPDVFAPFVDLVENLTCCKSCQALVRRRDIDERTAVWKCMPEIMGIEVEGWADGMEEEAESSSDDAE